ncbi:MAG: AhpC/TSA family protein [Actinobacteria bacterium]|nr:AhpC/TSA family protein [Actinomycetota bacterium]
MQLRDDREPFERAGARVVLVGIGTPERARAFCERRSIAFDCMTDPSRRAHRAYGLRRGTAWEVVGPGNWLPFARDSLRRETRQGRIREDPMQLPGTFVIDTSGVVRYAHRNRTASDNPPNEEILRVLAADPS